jgi:Cof subfamily protein (haloacid dehalogenase superfamily)
MGGFAMKKDIRIIALDLDGTLLNSNKELTQRNYRALEAAAARGIEIVPTTGRFYDAMPRVIRDLPFVNYAITINGAQVANVRTGAVLYRAEIPWQRAVELMTFLDTLPVVYDCFMDNAAFMTKTLQERIDEHTDDPHYRKMVRELRQGVPELKAFITEREQDVQKSQFFTMDMDLRARMLVEIPQRFPDLITTAALRHNVEINDIRANKGAAVLALAEHLGCGAEHVMAFGDGLNDLSMIEAAGMGVAMDNAFDEVKRCADYITDDCDHDGVAVAIEKFCF